MESPAPGILPPFRYAGVVLDPARLRYCPHPDIIHPSVIETGMLRDRAQAPYYMYYAPHDKPGGICLAFADRLEGPWEEYGRNPIVSNTSLPHYRVGHVSSPHAI